MSYRYRKLMKLMIVLSGLLSAQTLAQIPADSASDLPPVHFVCLPDFKLRVCTPAGQLVFQDSGSDRTPDIREPNSDPAFYCGVELERDGSLMGVNPNIFTFRDGDVIRFVVQAANRPAYLYVFRGEVDGRWAVLFPTRSASLSCGGSDISPGGKQYLLPAREPCVFPAPGHEGLLVAGGGPGLEHYFLALALRPLNVGDVVSYLNGEEVADEPRILRVRAIALARSVINLGWARDLIPSGLTTSPKSEEPSAYQHVVPLYLVRAAPGASQLIASIILKHVASEPPTLIDSVGVGSYQPPATTRPCLPPPAEKIGFAGRLKGGLGLGHKQKLPPLPCVTPYAVFGESGGSAFTVGSYPNE
jgi:hypothetical protein